METRKRILLVDDEKDVSISTEAVLRESGFNVESYEDPFYVIENFKINSYALVILDIKMPGINGFQLYRELKKKDKKVKICFLTAGEVYYGAFRDIFSAVDANCFIRKPVTNEELVERVSQIIDNDNKLVEVNSRQARS
jgi:FixJ family two-component response regulator